MEGEILAAISAVFGALLGGGFTYFGMKHQAQANVIAEARKNWIENVQEDCVRIYEAMNFLYFFDIQTQDSKEERDSYIALDKSIKRLILKLKPQEYQEQESLFDADRHKQLEESIDGLLEVCRIAYNSPGGLKSKEINDIWLKAEKKFENEARLVLNGTWRQVKEDAQGFRILP